jgi:hypothetical protein
MNFLRIEDACVSRTAGTMKMRSGLDIRILLTGLQYFNLCMWHPTELPKLSQNSFYSVNKKDFLLINICCRNKKYFDAATQFRLFHI